MSATDDFGDITSQGAFQMSISADGGAPGLPDLSISADDRSPGVLPMSVFADGWSQSAYEMSATAAVPELPAWMLLLIGLAGLQSARMLRPLAAVPAPLRSGRRRLRS